MLSNKELDDIAKEISAKNVIIKQKKNAQKNLLEHSAATTVITNGHGRKMMGTLANKKNEEDKATPKKRIKTETKTRIYRKGSKTEYIEVGPSEYNKLQSKNK